MITTITVKRSNLTFGDKNSGTSDNQGKIFDDNFLRSLLGFLGQNSLPKPKRWRLN